MPGVMTVAHAGGEGGARATVRGATAADVPAITRFLHGFWPQISPATWRSLFEYDWIEDKPDLGFVLTDAKGEIEQWWEERRQEDQQHIEAAVAAARKQGYDEGWAEAEKNVLAEYES